MVKNIRVIDVERVIGKHKVIYNESLMEIEHDNPPFPYWPVSENRLKNIENVRYEKLIGILKD